VKDSELVGLKSPLLYPLVHEVRLLLIIFLLEIAKLALCFLLLRGLSQFRVLILVTWGCVPELPSFTTAYKPLGKLHFRWKHWENSPCFQWEQG